MNTKHILAISGSLRKDSYNSHVVKAFAAQAPEGVSVEVADISAIPLYNQDDETTFPEAVVALKEKIAHADAIIIVTPEYNRSIPGILKNMIDWTSRPYGQSAWTGKVVYVAGASMGPLGTASAQYDLKKIMLYLNTTVIGQPEFYLGSVQNVFSAAGELTDDTTRAHIDAALQAIIAKI